VEKFFEKNQREAVNSLRAFFCHSDSLGWPSFEFPIDRIDLTSTPV
jgi:hypothetical protein